MISPACQTPPQRNSDSISRSPTGLSALYILHPTLHAAPPLLPSLPKKRFCAAVAARLRSPRAPHANRLSQNRSPLSALATLVSCSPGPLTPPLPSRLQRRSLPQTPPPGPNVLTSFILEPAPPLVHSVTLLPPLLSPSLAPPPPTIPGTPPPRPLQHRLASVGSLSMSPLSRQPPTPRAA